MRVGYIGERGKWVIFVMAVEAGHDKRPCNRLFGMREKACIAKSIIHFAQHKFISMCIARPNTRVRSRRNHGYQ